MVALKHKTKGFAAQPGQFVGVQPGHVFTGKQIASGRGSVEAAEDVHQRRFARTRGADDGHELARVNRQADTFEYVDFGGVDAAVDLADVVQVNQGSGHLASVAGGWADQQVITQRNQAQINRVIQQYNQIKAPTGGRVWQVLKEPGDYVRRGDLIARIGKSEQLYARLAVDEGSIAKVKVGQQVWIRLNTHPDSVAEGVVSEIAPLFDPAKQAYTVKVTWKGKIPIEIIGTQLEANLLVQKCS